MNTILTGFNRSFVPARAVLSNRRLVLPVVLVALLAAEPTRAIVFGVLADAFIQVSAFVAATLALYHSITHRLDKGGRLKLWLETNPTYQVVFAAAMGALPGCGGAIVVMTQFVKGQLGFGSVVAVLTATMGDAAFLLLAAKPVDGLMMIALGFVVGTLSGYLVESIHGGAFMRPQLVRAPSPVGCPFDEADCHAGSVYLQGIVWQWLLLPSMVVALLVSFQLDPNQVLGLPENSVETIAVAAIMLNLVLWAVTRDVGDYESAVSEDPKRSGGLMMQQVSQDTNFVTAWVVVAFLIFELLIAYTGWDLAALFARYQSVMPLMGVVVGLLPGCGPQILVTSLYISGAVPMSAQIGNAISNDGDALFPAIALAPRAAMLATIYSSIPALMAAYGYYYLFEV
jgi:hypothetical protein